MKVEYLRQRTYLSYLFTMIRGRDILMRDFKDALLNSIYLRHDIDDNIEAAWHMAKFEHEHGIKATYFILNTAPYWDSPDMWDKLHLIEELGHEIAWHNNVITQWLKTDCLMPLNDFIEDTLEAFRTNGFNIKGSASHGDPMCYKFQYLNYDVFKECPRLLNHHNLAVTIDAMIDMKDYGLEYEAYHIPFNQYFSESGGEWKALPEQADFKDDKITQILIHPQWWLQV